MRAKDAGDLHSVPSLPRMSVGTSAPRFSAAWAGQIWTKIWGFSPCLAFVLVPPPRALPFSVAGCWLSDSCGLAGLGDGSGDPRP